MLRFQTANGWMLIEHREHARLAGRFAQHYGNALFSPPEPLADILVAVFRHDDAWAERDVNPFLTREKRPSAFSKELVGKYSAFEEIDLIDYLAVRGRATEAVAKENPYAAIIISMHTVNLLTEQADLSGLPVPEREAHSKFISGQITRQKELADEYVRLGGKSENVSTATLRRAFEFLQAFDNLSLLACVGYPTESFLRHEHPEKSGARVKLRCVPLEAGSFQITPYPLTEDKLLFNYPARHVSASSCSDLETFREAYRTAEIQQLEVTLVK